jgi:ECF-type riboflavin transporter, S component/Squalene-hopene cyclase C-terminal domain/Prenyltransferase and squalene oxidase repeat
VSWQLASVAIVGLVLLAGLVWFERTRPSAKVVSLVATLAALAVVGRIAFAPFPNVKPTTDIVLFAGLAIGAAPGFAVGAITALASNVFFGQGPWTPWQMVAWGLVGVAGGLVGRVLHGREPRRLQLALICAAAGFGYGALLDFYQWTLGATHNLAAYVAVSGTSFPYNLAHAVGNFVFALAIGPAFVRALRRYRRRFEVRWAEPAIAAALLAALLVPSAPPSAQAATSAKSKALKYIERAQNTDGGFGGAPRQSSSPLYTGWVTLGIAAAGENPRDMRRGKTTPVSYTRHHLPSTTSVGDLERTILALRAAGVSAASFGHRDLVAQLKALRESDASWDHLVDHTAFGILALRAGGASPASLHSSAVWLVQQQNADGGFGFGKKGGASDADDTGSSIQALVAVGRGRTAAVRKAVTYLRHAQNPDGGFGQLKSDSSNAQSTSWAVQGLVAAKVNPGSLRRNGHTPISYITSLQQANGAVRYSRTSAQTPVWVTGQALTALARKPFPVKAPKRRAPVAPAKAATTPKPKPKPAPKTHKAKVVPVARAAAKKAHTTKPQSHGQTIATQQIKPVSDTRHPPPATHNEAPTHHHPLLGIALGALALATLIAGAYLTRKRLRGRPA